MSNSLSAPDVSLSIIVPSFNSGSYLKLAIESVLQQEVPVNLIVQDGGSTDGTVEYLESLGNSIVFHSTADTGQSQALNRALSLATGDFVGWLNADDIYLPGSLSSVIATIDQRPNADVIYGNYTKIRANGDIYRRYIVRPLQWERVFARGCYVWSGATFFKRSLLNELGGFDESLHYCMDLDLYLKVAGLESAHIDGYIGAFRIHSDSKTGSVPWKFLAEERLIRRRHSKGTFQHRWISAKMALLGVVYPATSKIWNSDTWARFRGTKNI